MTLVLSGMRPPTCGHVTMTVVTMVWVCDLFSHSVVSDSLWPHGLQHPRLPCPSLSPRVYSNSCPWSRWCHTTLLSSVTCFSSGPQSLSASGSFPISWLFASGGQSIGASASASVLPMNIQDWFPLGSTGLISLQSKGLSRVFSSTTVQKHRFFGTQPSLWSNSGTYRCAREGNQLRCPGADRTPFYSPPCSNPPGNGNWAPSQADLRDGRGAQVSNSGLLPDILPENKNRHDCIDL